MYFKPRVVCGFKYASEHCILSVVAAGPGVLGLHATENKKSSMTCSTAGSLYNSNHCGEIQMPALLTLICQSVSV